MKKVLSVVLAVMMIFGAMSMNVSAAPATTTNINFGKTVVTTTGDVYIDATKHVIVELDFNGGTSHEGLMVYDVDTPGFTLTLDVTGCHLMLPGCGYDMVPGEWIRLPAVTAPEGMRCKGWEIKGTGLFAGHGIDWQIPADSQGQVLELVACFEVAEVGDIYTPSMILLILLKVLGTIVGILFFDGNPTLGIEFMEKVLVR